MFFKSKIVGLQNHNRDIRNWCLRIMIPEKYWGHLTYLQSNNVWDLRSEIINQGQCISKTAHCKSYILRFDNDDIRKPKNI